MWLLHLKFTLLVIAVLVMIPSLYVVNYTYSGERSSVFDFVVGLLKDGRDNIYYGVK